MDGLVMYKMDVETCIQGLSTYRLEEIAKAIIECRGTIYILGNGGSLATALHLSCDLSKNTGKPIRTDTLSELPKVTAYANDIGYDSIYQMQLFSKLRPGDMLINISNSGNSQNLINATKFVKDCGNIVISLLGYSGGQLKDMSDLYVLVSSTNIRVVEDVHMVICHMLTKLVEKG